jgi:methylated-DNA-protein-cysteine methyltransferase-like protein
VTVDPEEYAEAVLRVVERVPRGRVTTYGAIADHLTAQGLPRGSRTVGRVMSRHGDGVPWWRVVRADGSLPPSHGEEARAAYLEEGTALTRSGRVVMTAAFWEPHEA